VRGNEIAAIPSGDDIVFQFTPLREGQLCFGKEPVPVNPFQFTPLREGQLIRKEVLKRGLAISIHAPA